MFPAVSEPTGDEVVGFEVLPPHCLRSAAFRRAGGMRIRSNGCMEGRWVANCLPRYFHRIIESQNGLGCKGAQCSLSSNPLLCAGSPTSSPGCPEPHPAWPWMPAGMGHPQPPWATCSVRHHPLSEKLPPTIKPKPLLSQFKTIPPCCEGMLLAHGQLAVHWAPQCLFCKAAFHSLGANCTDAWSSSSPSAGLDISICLTW